MTAQATASEIFYPERKRLVISPNNVNAKKKLGDITSLAATIREVGIRTPLEVEVLDDDTLGVISGRRRIGAVDYLREHEDLDVPIPCKWANAESDAQAVAISLIENVEREAMTPMAEHSAFATLARLGRSPEDIAATFALDVHHVRQRLALGTLDPYIQRAGENDEIGDEELRCLTLASKARRKEWIALHKNNDAPPYWELKRWVLGGAEINLAHALFEADAYTGPVSEDLFDDTTCFATDADAFWTLQDAAIDALRDTHARAGWSVDVLRDEPFEIWHYEKCAKKHGGRVYIDVRDNGEVVVHKGYAPYARQRRTANNESANETRAVSELSAPLTAYVNSHKRAAVAAALTEHPGVALRLLVASALGHWSVDAPRWPHGTKAGTVESVSASTAHATMTAAVSQAVAALGDDGADVCEASPTLLHAYRRSTAQTFAALLRLDDNAVLAVAAAAVAESLEPGSDAVDVAGDALDVDMTTQWAPDDAFWTLLTSKRTINAVLADVAGDDVAAGAKGETGKAQKAKAGALLAARTDAGDTWTPPWFQFPGTRYEDDAPPCEPSSA